MEQIVNFFYTLNAVVLLITLCFIALDVITGYAQAIANRNLQSDKMKQGFWHKLAVIFALMVAGLIDIMIQIGIGQQLGFATPIFECACLYVVIMELTSIMENIVKMNPALANTKFLNLFSYALTPQTTNDTITNDGAAPKE